MEEPIENKTIVFIITDYGSFNNFLGETAVQLAVKGAKIHVISSSEKVIKIKDKYDYVKEGIKFYNVDFPRGFNPIKHYRACRQIHKIVNNIQPNIISIHFTTGIFTSTFIKRFNFKTIGTIHGLGFPVVDGFVKSHIYKFVERRSMSRVDEVWVLNKADLNIIKNNFPRIKAYLLPTKGLGCDLYKFDPEKFTLDFKGKLKKQLGIRSGDFVITFTGRFVTFKGYDKVVRAFKILEEKGEHHIKLLLIGGSDNAHSSGLTKKEEDWVSENDSIINIGFSSNVENYLSITDLFVFPSEKEGMPVCIIEALAMDIPVITANARGCNDLIINGQNGILLKNNTAEEIALQIVNLKNNVNLYDLMKDKIKNRRDQLDRKLFVKQQLSFFSKKLI